jgi:hypothetical protein
MKYGKLDYRQLRLVVQSPIMDGLSRVGVPAIVD